MLRTVICPLRPAILLVLGMMLTACGGSESNTAVVTTATPTIFYAHAVAFRNNTAVAWGYNANGQLGTGTSTTHTTPVLVNGGSVTGMDGLAVGGTHNIVFDNISGGAVKTWGNNGVGQLGDGTETAQSVPVNVLRDDDTLLIGVQAVAAGAAHSLALRRDGTVWAWGYNGYGQLGINSNVSRSAKAVRVVGDPEIDALPEGITSIAAGGSHSLALDGLGRVWGWGYNGYGQLGDGTTTDRLVPTRVIFPEAVTIIAIAAGGSTSLAIDSNHEVWGWGYNKYGQAGTAPGVGEDGVRQIVPAKVKLTDAPDPVTYLTAVSKIAVGLDHSLALREDGTMWAWGFNSYRQLGQGEDDVISTTEAANPFPKQVVAGEITGTISDIRAIGHYSLAAADGKVYAWGMNSYYQLGNGTTTNSSAPKLVTGY